MSSKIYIINARGEQEPFSYTKVYRSAKRAGADEKLARQIAHNIEQNVYSGIKTFDIFKQVKARLRKQAPLVAIRFNLKQAIRKLGPTGFPFEKYMASIFAVLGFEVKLNQIVKGSCVEYEIDFLAQKQNELKIVECKFRNLSEGKVDTNNILIMYAKFLDIQRGSFFKEKVNSTVITNTKFTTRAIKYANCMGIELLGWNYPRNNGLERLIENNKLYPITILPSLNRSLADYFVAKKIMLAKDIVSINPSRVAQQTRVHQNKINNLIKEAKTLL